MLKPKDLILHALMVVSLAGVAVRGHCADLKIATVAPEGSQWMATMRAAAAEIRSDSEGRVNLKLYGGGVMGTDRQVLRKMRIGQLQGGVFTAATLAGINPDVAVYGMPLTFRSQREVDYVRERMDGTLRDDLLRKGYVSFGFVGGGFALFISQKPARQLADLSGRKIWIPEGDSIGTAAMKALGLAPVSLPITDVLTGLQTGLIDVVAAPPAGAIALQWHTRMRFVTDLPLAYTFAALVVDANAFNRLAVGDQAIVRNVLYRVHQELDRRASPDNDMAAAALAGAGLRFVAPAAGDIESWRAAVSQAQGRMVADGLVSTAAIEELERLLADYRRTEATGTVPIAMSAPAPR
jgi:TRAP-type C4-dicarboxylate transport system substrate-binding protein